MVGPPSRVSRLVRAAHTLVHPLVSSRLLSECLLLPQHDDDRVTTQRNTVATPFQ